MRIDAYINTLQALMAEHGPETPVVRRSDFAGWASANTPEVLVLFNPYNGMWFSWPRTAAHRRKAKTVVMV